MMSLRTFPIRVGNIVDADGKELGNSGPFHPDSVETTFAALGVPEELTTVTKRVRRIASFSQQQYKAANYVKDQYVFSELVKEINKTRPVTHVGIGPSVNDVVDVTAMNSIEAAMTVYEQMHEKAA